MDRVADLLSAILKLKKLLGTEGNYSICRSDRKPMGWPDMIHVGQVLEDISKAIAEINEAYYQS